MTQSPPAIRILPMDSKATPGFVGASIEDVQRLFFLNALVVQPVPGRFHYCKSGLRAEPGTVVLFQFQGRIIASAILVGIERFETPEPGGHVGAYLFDVESIRVFDPVDAATLGKVWPNVSRLGQAKWDLDPKGYAKFERMLTGVETANSYEQLKG